MRFDLDFRPRSYADFGDPVALALNGIKGHQRREMVRDMLSAEGEKRAAYDELLGPVAEEILDESAPEGFTHRLNHAFGPSWLGGEFLPDLGSGEMEIARIVLASVTMDVFSVRARFTGGRYRYRFVDEYGCRFEVRPKTSRRPLTLGRLVELIDTAWSEDLADGGQPFVEAWWWQQWDAGLYTPEACTDFAWVESETYPELADFYVERARQWRIARAPEWAKLQGEDAS